MAARCPRCHGTRFVGRGSNRGPCPACNANAPGDKITGLVQPTPTPTTVPDLLRAARTELNRRGWAQNDYGTPVGRVCLVGALLAAFGCDPLDDPLQEPSTPAGMRLLADALDALVRHIAPVRTDEEFEYPEDLGYYSIDHVTTWNDTAGRTLDEVLALLDTTANAETDGTAICTSQAA
jgi:hypothetical protein